MNLHAFTAASAPASARWTLIRSNILSLRSASAAAIVRPHVLRAPSTSALVSSKSRISRLPLLPARVPVPPAKDARQDRNNQPRSAAYPAEFFYTGKAPASAGAFLMSFSLDSFVSASQSIQASLCFVNSRPYCCSAAISSCSLSKVCISNLRTPASNAVSSSSIASGVFVRSSRTSMALSLRASSVLSVAKSSTFTR